MRSVALLARDPRTGEVKPYHATGAGLRALDGSLSNDIPGRELGFLFHADALVVSQANPHISPFVKLALRGTKGGGILRALSLWLLFDVKHRVGLLAGLRLLPRWFAEDVPDVFTQSYLGDVTILPEQHWGQALRVLTQPRTADLRQLILDGERATWPHLPHLRVLILVERTLSTLANRFKECAEDDVECAALLSHATLMGRVRDSQALSRVTSYTIPPSAGSHEEHIGDATMLRQAGLLHLSTREAQAIRNAAAEAPPALPVSTLSPTVGLSLEPQGWISSPHAA
jgi:hypothetical protein